MEWGRSREGNKAHQFYDGESLCGVVLVKRVDARDVKDEERCKSCDETLRHPGKEQRKAERAKSSPKEIYRPRHTFEDWEAGR